MKHVTKIIALLLTLAISSSCATPSGRAREQTISFARLDNLIIGRTTKIEVSRLFGEGSIQLESINDQRLIWLYFLPPPGYQRLSLSFDTKTEVLQSMVWFVNSHEPEIKLETAMRRFPNAQFVKHSFYRQIADYIDIIKSYDDEKSGVSIYPASNDREVESISFYRPGLVKEYKDELTWKPKATDYKILVDNYHKTTIRAAQSTN